MQIGLEKKCTTDIYPNHTEVVSLLIYPILLLQVFNWVHFTLWFYVTIMSHTKYEENTIKASSCVTTESWLSVSKSEKEWRGHGGGHHLISKKKIAICVQSFNLLQNAGKKVKKLCQFIFHNINEVLSLMKFELFCVH